MCREALPLNRKSLMLRSLMEKSSVQSLVQSPWSVSFDGVLADLRCDFAQGLDTGSVEERVRTFGKNRLTASRSASRWTILVNQFRSLIVGLLVAAAVLSAVLSDWMEFFAILLVIAINAAIGFFTELKAVRSMESLKKIGGRVAHVRRGGELVEIPAEDLVPGDILVLQEGDLVGADVRLGRISRLEVDESTLTGESVPATKSTDPMASDAVLADRSNMAFRGTVVTRGTGEGVVTATGMSTELGRIAQLTEEAEEEVTPLEEQLDRLGRKLIWVTVAITVLVVAIGVLAGNSSILMLKTAIALAVAAIPEGLPIVATIALARGVWRMAKRNALINKLSAVETLGATNVIFTDKTGTLTENRMTVSEYALLDSVICLEWQNGVPLFDGNPEPPPSLTCALEVGRLCNNAAWNSQEQSGIGDPTEVALLRTAPSVAMKRRLREDPFDSDTKNMATFHEDGNCVLVAVKGAAEAVLPHCTGDREGNPLTEHQLSQLSEQAREMAAKGLRVLGLARKRVDSAEVPPYQQLQFLALVGILDPPRADVAPALARCNRAGISVVMVTGDQRETARSIAARISLVPSTDAITINGTEIPEDLNSLPPSEQEKYLQCRIFSRLTPKQKLDLIALFQSRDNVVAMTGDGVNDAPALKKADIGVAMGKRGTEVAREASDMVLRDDAFGTIISAVEQGRVIFDNIRKFVMYLLSCNLSEILVVSVATAAALPLPLHPLHILFLNLVTDVFPALALGALEGDHHIMERPPRPSQEGVLAKRHWLEIGAFGGVMTVAVMVVYLWFLRSESHRVASTLAFLTLGFSQLSHVFNMRPWGSRFFSNNVLRTPLIWLTLAFCTLLMLATVYLPPVAQALMLAVPTGEQWLWVVVASQLPLLFGVIKNFPLVGPTPSPSGTPLK